MRKQLSPKNYRWITFALCLLFIGITILAVVGTIPSYIGTIVFLAAIAWVLYGLWFVKPYSSKQ